MVMLSWKAALGCSRLSHLLPDTSCKRQYCAFSRLESDDPLVSHIYSIKDKCWKCFLCISQIAKTKQHEQWLWPISVTKSPPSLILSTGRKVWIADCAQQRNCAEIACHSQLSIRSHHSRSSVIPSQKDNAHFWPVETNCALSRSWTTNKLFYLPAHSSTSRKQCIATLRRFACREARPTKLFFLQT